MKQTLTFLMIILFANVASAQHEHYTDLWEKVEQLEADGLPKSALKVVETIAKKAKKTSNTPQLIKTMLFKSKFALILEEDAQLKIINDFKTEIAESKFPTKNVLKSLLANLYWQYFKQNRWKFYNRTKTSEKVDTSDFRTWDLQTLFNEIHLHYQNSLASGLMLQQEKLSDFDAILNLQKDSKKYRPTLFDFLSHEALDFYKTNETHITKPAFKFEIDNPDFLADAKTFSEIKITSKDSTSLQLNALKIYQDLIQFHLKDNTPYAVADVDIQRLKFINQQATFSNKETLFLNALEAGKNQHKLHEASGLYAFEIANLYFQQSQKYEAKTSEDFRWKAKDAIGICDQVIAKFPESHGTEKCIALKQTIESQSLRITSESYLPIQKHAKILVDYKNIDALNFKLFKLKRKELETFEKTYRKEDKLDFIKKLNANKSWESVLKNENDYQQHSTEILIPKLVGGDYLMYAEVKNNPETFAFATVQITNLAVVETETNTQKIFQIINRNNGAPIKNTSVALRYTERNSQAINTDNYTTNANGEIRIEKTNDWYQNVALKITNSNETAYFGKYYINSSYQEPREKTQHKAFVFTDRSIYRPGQTVFFKAIALKSKNNKSEVVNNEPVYAELYNVNDEKIAELEFRTNDFGSVSGEFILPNTGLNGEYHIKFNGKNKNLFTNQYFSVEEYKRPKFKTEFKPVTDTYKINDSVTVIGNALAYAGSNITNAKVVYRVHRKVQYPRWFFWHRPYYNSEPQEITHGETITNEKGEFEITFKALPDQSVDKNNLPIFNYEITADVTDLNGETRSATTIVNVGYHALTANITIDALLDKSKKNHRISIETKNLNGEFVPANGIIKIHKLTAPKTVLRQRPWKAPDYQEFSKEAYKNLFPHEAYNNEQNPDAWEKGDLVFSKNFDTDKSKNIALGKLKKWKSGLYIVTLETKDKFGQHVKDEVRTTLYSENDASLADNQLFSITSNKPNYKVGETAVITLATAAENLSVTVRIEKDKKIVKTEIIQLNNNKKRISIPVESNDVGGFVVHYSFAAFNSYKSGSTTISVPYPKTDLNIETTTFRDKLQPGTNETWSFKIKGLQGEKVSAEILASMYDASLDQFQPHDWYFNPNYSPTYYSRCNTRAYNSFNNTNFQVYHFNPQKSYPQQYYDKLNWFGFRLNFNKWRYDNYVKNLRLKLETSYDSKLKDGFISGTVQDENGSPIPGVNVIIKGTSNGVSTDFDGNYSIEASKKQTLIFSFLGYNTREINVKNYNKINVTLSEDSASLDEVVVVGYGLQKRESITGAAVAMAPAEAEADNFKSNETVIEETQKKPNKEKPETFDNIQIRKNLQETAFFFPQLQTDEAGNISFSFTTPEALTQWKLQLLAHTKTLESATKTLTAVTQKELMVIPNTPRFLRHGDSITISTKIANLTDKQLSGKAHLVLTDAITGEDITKDLIRLSDEKTFSVNPKANTQVSWNLTIPDDVDAVQYKIIAKSETFSDGEQNALPVLSNRMLITETLPMWIKSNETRTFTLDKLKTNTSATLKHHKLTLEITSNPAWYAVQALPYLMEYPYECNEQTFSRYYANALASHIANSNPRIQDVFNQWANANALISNLEKNEELKSILIQETPWLRDAQNETEQKKRIALLFDMNKMTNELKSAINKLKSNQLNSGAWAWFKGGRENRYITQHIISGFGHLKKLNVSGIEASQMIENAIKYLDSEFVQEYKDIRKYNSKVDLSKDHLSYTQLQYLYMRSFFPEIETSKEVEKIMAYYQTQIQKYWLNRSLYAKGLMTLISFRNGDKNTASKILKSLKETSISNDELGMYWKSNTNSWFWYQAPIETQALMIEAFSEAGESLYVKLSTVEAEKKHLETIDNLKIWLLKNKQTNRWKTTKATTEAVYALLLQGSDWLSVNDAVDVLVGNKKIEAKKLENVKVEAGTGYFKTAWNPSEITPEMANVTLTKKGNGIAWGGLYWQYFEDLDKVTSAETPLSLKKKLFKKTNTSYGEEITEITPNTTLEVGDLVRIRIELRSDRAMEFIHMKDMRASGLEPINVISQYKWQDGLGYYESTKDASTNFFFDYLPKGVYVFEYDLRVNNAGNMSNGITTIQSMYAPEFSSHSEGVRINVN
ncbi:alpha-2-macroglobulin [Tamlana nanhaiensis]|uniref:Alpha-2-macroglobulin n=1 Tax=Neotamlana nanhaiensis TaxID=1382798 RepID=A0A0D7VXD6_9FLAO|nr:carboxypeptidase-like regulatory domain-containing protein [Tamlana nanhaiensis]KJD31511.1 alpha-2-macroglobulin [Tamlana nanhaiensis]